MENNQLIKSSQMPMSDIVRISQAFIQSGFFKDTESVAGAIVKVQAGQEIGVAPFAAMTGIHIIKGKPVIGSGIMASRIKSSGKYDYKVVKLTPEICSLDFYHGTELIANETFTIEDAHRAGTGKGGVDGKMIDKYPKNMLFARCLSNGIKFYCPDLFAGPVYTPEEIPNEEKEIQDAIDDIYTSVTLDELREKREDYSHLEAFSGKYKKALAKKYELLKEEEKEKPAVIAAPVIIEPAAEIVAEIPTAANQVTFQNSEVGATIEKLESAVAEKEKAALDDLENCKTLDDTMIVLKKYNGFSNTNPVYKKALDDKIFLLLHTQLDEAIEKLEPCTENKQVAEILISYPSLVKNPEFKPLFMDAIDAAYAKIVDLKAVKA